ncbi:hypothetical protein BE1S18E01_14680 [Acinetobacter sp. BEC1-S18-ESBL-01]|jgi:hypothetical protein|uniref:DUF6527 family protein n=1 Tax=Acinetobacter TaxID=469 RepID=UPI0002D0E790|nr:MULTISPECIES: DUF6527 family protein [Acinetobacter]AMO40492.1 hypothetical protein A0J50_07405 [Acinetobacter sp. DUT-2]ENW11900.1 hypothetical protein F930_01855 [Acinetobacter pittii ANC 3678]MCU4471016.1 hypothetical protein [Acinetobacter pittii]MCU4485743.1 hypothetical protein [Acinetobacter pittii]MDE4039333.1 DUF6527 family protein [Acinetobacter pittii]
MKVQYFEGGMYKHMCPACGYLHYIPVHYPFSNGNQWFFNGNLEKPTFDPIISINEYCNYFIKDGFIEYSVNCRHHLAACKVELPELKLKNYRIY